MSTPMDQDDETSRAVSGLIESYPELELSRHDGPFPKGIGAFEELPYREQLRIQEAEEAERWRKFRESSLRKMNEYLEEKRKEMQAKKAEHRRIREERRARWAELREQEQKTRDDAGTSTLSNSFERTPEETEVPVASKVQEAVPILETKVKKSVPKKPRAPRAQKVSQKSQDRSSELPRAPKLSLSPQPKAKTPGFNVLDDLLMSSDDEQSLDSTSSAMAQPSGELPVKTREELLAELIVSSDDELENSFDHLGLSNSRRNSLKNTVQAAVKKPKKELSAAQPCAPRAQSALQAQYDPRIEAQAVPRNFARRPEVSLKRKALAAHVKANLAKIGKTSQKL